MNLVRNNRLLWTIQALLALLFLFAGGMKLVTSAEALAAMAPPGTQVSTGFLRVIGVLEVCGALGLVLPGLLHIRERLTPLAAAGLVGIMIGATIVTAIGMSVAQALLPLCVGLLAAFVAYARSRRPARQAVATA